MVRIKCPKCRKKFKEDDPKWKNHVQRHHPSSKAQKS